MRNLLTLAALVLLAAPPRLQAADVGLGTCETSVGGWEFTSKEGGRAVIARDGTRYHVMWVTTFVDANGKSQPEGIAAECTCQDAPHKLVWSCRVAFSFESGLVGTQQKYEWAVDGGTLSTWYVAPDGTRSATPLRRVK